MIKFFIICDALCLFALVYKKIKFNNPLPWMFCAFINLYTLCSYFAVKYKLKYRIDVLNEKTVEVFLFTSGLSLLTYALLLVFSKTYRVSYTIALTNKTINHFFILLVIFPVAFYINSISNWTLERTGIKASLAAYARNIVTVLVLIILLTKSLPKYIKYISVLFGAVITLVSTQRTNFMIMLIGLLLVEQKHVKAILLCVVGVFFLLVIGLVRNGVNVLALTYPIMGEGVFGSWGMLDAINYYLVNGYDYENLIKPINPAINWLIPILHLPVMSDGVPPHATMGGGFFLSDAYLWHPYLGPILYTVVFHYVNSWSYRKLMTAHKDKINYFIIQCYLVICIKALIATVTAMLTFLFLACYLYRAFISLLSLSTQPVRRPYSSGVK